MTHTIRNGRDYLTYRLASAGTVEIEDIAVYSGRRRGAGRALVEAMLAALPAGTVTVYALCRAENAGAHAFYAALGFVRSAELADFYRDQDRGAVLFVRRLP